MSIDHSLNIDAKCYLSSLYSLYLRYYNYLWLVLVLIATNIPMLWGETWLNCLLICSLNRTIWTGHFAANVNSAAHMFGDKPYNEHSTAVDNKWVLAYGECFHNYHHKFPMDYSTSESPHMINSATHFIDLMARLGLAYDLKRASGDMVDSAKEKTASRQQVVQGV